MSGMVSRRLLIIQRRIVQVLLVRTKPYRREGEQSGVEIRKCGEWTRWRLGMAKAKIEKWT